MCWRSKEITALIPCCLDCKWLLPRWKAVWHLLKWLNIVLAWKWKLHSCVRLFVTPWTIQSKEFSRPEYWNGWPFTSLRDLPNPGNKPRSPPLHADSLPAELRGKSKDTGMGSLSLLQRIFPTQESNHGLLHCRRILYQLSYQGSRWEVSGGIKKTSVFLS